MRILLPTESTTKKWAAFCATVGLLVFTFVPAHAAKYEEGLHYYTLTEAQPVQTGDKIEVVELFWYHCPHCFALEPVLDEWLEKEQPANSEYVRMPGIFRRSTIFDAQVYYTLEALGMTGQLHADVFQEIHVRKNPFKSLDDLDSLLDKHGISKADFKAAFDSFAVDTKMKHAQLMFERYQATGVPTMVIDGKYRATASTAGGHEELMQLTNYLVEKAAAERQ